MTVTCIIQARTGSSRLPGKVLADLGGVPMLAFMLERLEGLKVDHLVVATTPRPADDAVAAIAARSGVPAVRGSEEDVLDRFRGALEQYPADTIVRLTADCPLTDPELVAEAISYHHARSADYTSNTLIRTYPDGLDVEVMRASALKTAAVEATEPIEREHVTPFIYRHPERFHLVGLRNELLLGGERWTVDTREDLEFLRSVMARLGDRRAGWRDVLGIVGRRQAEPRDRFILRAAMATDTEWIGAWVGLHLEEPSVRTWVAEVDRSPLGWLRVDVNAGEGRLSFEMPNPYLAEALGALQRFLREDFQVRWLWLRHPEAATLEAPTCDVLAGLGFEWVGRGLRWTR